MPRKGLYDTKKGLGQETQDVFLLPQKQTCFAPDGRKVIKNYKGSIPIQTRVRPISILLPARGGQVR